VPRKKSGAKASTSAPPEANLADFDRARWLQWLNIGIMNWLAPKDLGEKVTAFVPLTIDEGKRPDLEIHRKLGTTLSGPALAALRAAVRDLLTGWSADDGVERARFALRMAIRFGCEDLEVAIAGVLAKPMTLGRMGRIELTLAIVDAIRARCTVETMIELGSRMRQKSLLPWQAAVPLFVHAIVADPRKLSLAANAICPQWATDWNVVPLGDEAELFALELLDAFEPEGLFALIDRPDISLNFRSFVCGIAQRYLFESVEKRVSKQKDEVSFYGRLATGDRFQFARGISADSPLRDLAFGSLNILDAFFSGGVDSHLEPKLNPAKESVH
jgi:hypothetical protein